MNRHERRRAAAAKLARKRAILKAVDYLAHVAKPTATGATVITPHGEMIYLDAATVRDVASVETPRGRGS